MLVKLLLHGQVRLTALKTLQAAFPHIIENQITISILGITGKCIRSTTGLWTGNGFIMPERKCILKPEGVKQRIIDLPPSEERDGSKK